jgi:hypothetical protein
MKRRDCVSLVLALAILLVVACTERSTPTEPSVAPTAGSLPASLAGKVTTSGGVLESGLVLCQGRSVPTASDGTYSLTGLMSGPASVRVLYNATDSQVFTTFLVPGPNTQDFYLYLL